MTVKEDIKSLLAKESYTITDMAKKLTEKTGKKIYSKNFISKVNKRNIALQ